jgi:hypothetical protein
MRKHNSSYSSLLDGDFVQSGRWSPTFLRLYAVTAQKTTLGTFTQKKPENDMNINLTKTTPGLAFTASIMAR